MIARLAVVVGLALAGLTVWLCDAHSKPDHVTFLRLDPAFYGKALTSRKPILIYVTSPTDRACQELNRGALMDERVIAALEPFARFKVDVTAHDARGEQIAALLDLGASPPTFIFTNADGNEVARLVGPRSAEALVDAATKALRK